MSTRRLRVGRGTTPSLYTFTAKRCVMLRTVCLLVAILFASALAAPTARGHERSAERDTTESVSESNSTPFAGGVFVERAERSVHGLAIAGGFVRLRSSLQGAVISPGIVLVDEEADGLMLGSLFARTRNDLDGVAISSLSFVHGTMRGLLLGGIGAGAGGGVRDIIFGGSSDDAGLGLRGITVGGLLAGTRGDAVGLLGAGFAARAQGDVRGLVTAGAVARAEHLRGVGLCLVSVTADRLDGVALAQGVTVGQARGLALGAVIVDVGTQRVPGVLKGVAIRAVTHVQGVQRGLTIGLLNHTQELHGVQIGLLNVARNNPLLLRVLPLININM